MKKYRKNLLIFASGSKDGGGSGARKLIETSIEGRLQANIVGLVSNHEFGGVRKLADEYGIPFFYSPKGRTAEDYQRFVRETKADYVALSGWLGFVEGLDPKTTFNIHPAWLPSSYGGKGWHGDHVHTAVLADYRNGLVKHHGVTMHFATAKYDDPAAIIFRRKVEILADDTLESLRSRVNKTEHQWQAYITNLVVTGVITWDGKNSSSIVGADIEEE